MLETKKIHSDEWHHWGYIGRWHGFPIRYCPYPDHVISVKLVSRCDNWVKGWLGASGGNL